MKPAPVKAFKLNGKALVPDTTERIIRFLDQQADDELFTTTQLAGVVDKGDGRLRQLVRNKRLFGYSAAVSRQLRYWGSKQAIANWRKAEKDIEDHRRFSATP